MTHCPRRHCSLEQHPPPHPTPMQTIFSKVFQVFVAGLILAAPVSAATILPNLYSERFCQLRELGATKEAAKWRALEDATISGDNWIMLTRPDGSTTRSDIVEAANATVKRCLELVK